MFDLSSKSLNTHLNFPRNFEDQQDSGACSPPLWRTSPQKKSPSQKQINYQNLSPVSKAQIIARGQKELMEMVSKLPESCYELSLKDLVEVNTEEEDKVFDEMPQKEKKNPSRVVRKMKSDKWVDPRGVNKNGFLLNLGFSVSFGAKRKTKTKKKDDDDDGDCSVTYKNSWISPRRSVSDLSVKREDKDWWRNRLSESRRNQRCVSRVNSSSRSNSDRSRNNIRHENNGCLSFLWNVHLRD